jgi:hypothetical protein
MGKAAEYLVAAVCILATRGQLNVSTSLVDDEGVDLVFHRRGGTATLAVQVKARMSDSKRVRDESFFARIRSQTFKPRPDFDVLCVAVDIARGSIMKAWLVPSVDFSGMSTTTDGHYRFRASMKEGSQDQWRRYRLEADELASRILARLNQLDRSGD